MRTRMLLADSIDFVTGGTLEIAGPQNLSRLRLVFNGIAAAGVTFDFDTYGPITIDHSGQNAKGQMVSLGTARGAWVYQHMDQGINDRTTTAAGATQAVLDFRFFALGHNRNTFPLGANERIMITLPAQGLAVLASGTVEVYTVQAHGGCEYIPRMTTGTIPVLPGAGGTTVRNLPDNLHFLVLHAATGGGAANPGLIHIMDGDGRVLARGTFDGFRRAAIAQYDVEATMTDCIIPLNYHDTVWAESLYSGIQLQMVGGVGAMNYTMVSLEFHAGLTDRSVRVVAQEKSEIAIRVEKSSAPAVVKSALMGKLSAEGSALPGRPAMATAASLARRGVRAKIY